MKILKKEEAKIPTSKSEKATCPSVPVDWAIRHFRHFFAPKTFIVVQNSNNRCSQASIHSLRHTCFEKWSSKREYCFYCSARPPAPRLFRLPSILFAAANKLEGKEKASWREKRSSTGQRLPPNSTGKTTERGSIFSSRRIQSGKGKSFHFCCKQNGRQEKGAPARSGIPRGEGRLQTRMAKQQRGQNVSSRRIQSGKGKSFHFCCKHNGRQGKDAAARSGIQIVKQQRGPNLSSKLRANIREN